MKWWKSAIAAALFLAVAAITLGGLRQRPPPAVEVQFAKAKKGSITRTVTGAGKVEAVTTVKISSNLSGDLIVRSPGDNCWVKLIAGASKLPPSKRWRPRAPLAPTLRCRR